MIKADNSFRYLASDKYVDGSSGPVRDIDPFTMMGTFNRGTRLNTRRGTAARVAEFLGVTEPVPAEFDGIPLLNNWSSWLFPPENKRDPDHIDALWRLFATAIEYADSDVDVPREELILAFDDVAGRRGVGWQRGTGLYWARPWAFMPLDSYTRTYIEHELDIKIGASAPDRRCSGSEYLALIDTLNQRFEEPDYPANSFPKLSYVAWKYTPEEAADRESEAVESGADDTAAVKILDTVEKYDTYSVAEIITEGSFYERYEINDILASLRNKKNLILQGPPGTGKTWLAKKLDFALMGEKNPANVRVMQFHANLSYEDFVRGFRPTPDGKLVVADGPFVDMVKKAKDTPSEIFVFVIEEINRGNPAQIFGELLTLIEAGKRTPSEAIDLSYPDRDGNRKLHVPENLYVIGTMNIADRSLALVDLALRRRFAFVTLEPRLGPRWLDWVTTQGGVDGAHAREIERRINHLNKTIAADASLGAQFRIGHSYVTPPHPIEPGTTREWFRRVVDTEISPLLVEYWFESPATAAKAIDELKANW